MITLKNNTKETCKLGFAVTIDPKDNHAFVYATPNSTKVIGITTQSVSYRGMCKIATLGDKANVYVSGNVVKGNILRLSKTTDRASLGASVIAKDGDSPYIRIGEALTSGRGLIPCVLDFTYLQSDSTSIRWNDIGNPPVRIVIDDTTETTTDYTIICNKATAMAVTLLPATGSSRVIEVANINTGDVTITPSGVETIDGETTQVASQWDTITIKDYAQYNWKII